MSCSDLKTRLENARTALDDLMLGRRPVVVVDQNGERVEYSRVRASDLAAYVRQLEGQYAKCLEAENGGVVTGPMRVWM